MLASRRHALAGLLRVLAVRQGITASELLWLDAEKGFLSPLTSLTEQPRQQQQLSSLAAFRGTSLEPFSSRTYSKRSQGVPPADGRRSKGAKLKKSKAKSNAIAMHEEKTNDNPLSYRQLKREAVQNRAAVDPFIASDEGKLVVRAALQSFAGSSAMKDRSLALYVSAKAFPVLVEKFRQFLMDSITESLQQFMLQSAKSARMNALFSLFAEYVVDQHSSELKAYRETVRTMDLRRPYLWYPVARALRRKLIYHAGPTNSGKTFMALEAMRQAESGMYCGPLRLLAMEVYDSCNAAGTYCNLITGQERKMIPGATHTSCTIEMSSMSRRVDVGVIDEIQMLGDSSRGWAWTRALQGLPANEIHLCGDGSAIPLVRNLATAMGESLEVRDYERFTPIKVEDAGLQNGFKDVQPGDCMVAFSRKAIYEIKSLVESTIGLRTCVVYGALPPETRRQQARLFNDDDNEFSVMVASDAVGMGLNLNIRRIIFSTLTKLEGGERKQISVSEIKQIAGRAGRRNSQYPVGYVTCLDPSDIPALKEAMAVPLSELSTPAAGLFPEFENLEAYAGKSLETDFCRILQHFAQDAQLDGTYFFCRQESMEMAARLLMKIEGLSLQEKYAFCNAPLNLREPRHAAALLHFAARFAAKQPVHLEVHPPSQAPQTPEELHHMENLHQVVSVWLWLSLRFEPAAFPGREAAVELSDRMIEQMDEALTRMYATPQADHHKQMHKPRKFSEVIKEVRQSFVKNLEWEAKQHLQVASSERIKIMKDRRNRSLKQARDRKLLLPGQLNVGRTQQLAHAPA